MLPINYSNPEILTVKLIIFAGIKGISQSNTEMLSCFLSLNYKLFS